MSPKLKFEIISKAEVPKEETSTPSEKQRPVVLIVDDERVIADTLSMILSRSGFSTMTAYDGTSALALATATPPDLLISDVVMPGMTGVELAITLTQIIPRCKVLLFSGQAATVDLLEKARHDGHDFIALAKPVHPTDMLRRISECLGTRETNFKPVPPLATEDNRSMASLPN
jgi:CheY-like chemotaxis protein